MNVFESKFQKHGQMTLPEFTGLRIMMLPIILGVMPSGPILPKRQFMNEGFQA